MKEPHGIDVVSYHERTKHRFDGYAKGPETIDWEAQPDPFRRFEGAPQIKLPLSADALNVSYAALYDGSAIAAQPLQRDSLARLLEISLALSAWKQYGTSKWSLRCNPSSGNLHPTEAYLITTAVDGLDDGVYHYRADEHLLEQRCRFTPDETSTPPTLLLGLSSVHWREAWKYGERAYRYCQLDVGHAVAALSFAASVLGWRITPHYEIGDDQLSHLLGVNRRDDFADVETEHPDLLLAIHPATGGATSPAQLLSRYANASWYGQANRLDPKHHYTWPVIEQVAAACTKPGATDSHPVTFDPLPPPLPTPCQEPAAELFRRRRSAQAFDGVTPMAREDFFCLLDHLLPRTALAPWQGVTWQARIHLVLFVHRVSGLKPGLYALLRRSGAREMMQTAMRSEFNWQKVEGAPDHLPFYQLIAAKAGRTAATLACQQSIAGDSAFSLAMLAEFEQTIHDAPWRYRELYWEAGTIGQQLYLEAESAGLRGTGIGCFFDDGVHELLGLQDRQLQSLYHFTVGAPLADTRLITLPPYPERV